MAYSRQQLEDALVAAHNAGDTEAANLIAGEIRSISNPKPVTAGERVGAVGAGFNRGVAGFAGMPVDFLLNVWDLGKAGVGYTQSKITGKPPSPIFDPANRLEYAGSSEHIAHLMNKTPYTDTRIPRPDDKISQYLYAGGSALPGAMLMKPTTAGQAASATAANVVPTLAAKGVADATSGTQYENMAPIMASLLAQGGVNYMMRPKPQKPVDTVRRDTLEKSQEEGYVVPPSTTNPTVTNKLLESIGGKVATQQDAAIKNASITDALARRALGLPEEAPITRQGLASIRDDLAPAYEAVKKVGTITADKQYKDALGALASKYDKAASAFPGLANEDIGNLVKSMDQPAFDADAAIDATKILRDKSNELYAKGDKTLGKAYRQVSNELEAVIERNLPPKSTILQDFREARKTIAKTYSVEKALNDSTGHVSAIELAKQLKKGTPLSAELETAARFGQAFPKAAQSVNDSGAVRNTDVMMGAGTSAISREPSWLLYPFARMGMRSALLSDTGQKLALPSLPSNSVELQSPEMQRAILMFNQALLSQRAGEAVENRQR